MSVLCSVFCALFRLVSSIRRFPCPSDKKTLWTRRRRILIKDPAFAPFLPSFLHIFQLVLHSSLFASVDSQSPSLSLYLQHLHLHLHTHTRAPTHTLSLNSVSFEKNTIIYSQKMLSTLALFALPLLAASAPLKRGSNSKFTFYDTSVGLGACGLAHANSEYTVALNAADWSSYGSGYPNPVCGSEIWITYGGKTVTATVQDMCPGCPSNGLDLSESLFSALASQDLGVIYGSWGFGSAGSSNEPATTVAAEVLTPSTAAAAAPATPTVSAVPSAAPAVASSTPVVYPWTAVDPSKACVGSQIILWNETSVVYNGTASQIELNVTEPSVVEWCFNGTLSGNFTELSFLGVDVTNGTTNGTAAF